MGVAQHEPHHAVPTTSSSSLRIRVQQSIPVHAPSHLVWSGCHSLWLSLALSYSLFLSVSLTLSLSLHISLSRSLSLCLNSILSSVLPVFQMLFNTLTLLLIGSPCAKALQEPRDCCLLGLIPKKAGLSVTTWPCHTSISIYVQQGQTRWSSISDIYASVDVISKKHYSEQVLDRLPNTAVCMVEERQKQNNEGE